MIGFNLPDELAVFDAVFMIGADQVGQAGVKPGDALEALGRRFKVTSVERTRRPPEMPADIFAALPALVVADWPCYYEIRVEEEGAGHG